MCLSSHVEALPVSSSALWAQQLVPRVRNETAEQVHFLDASEASKKMFLNQSRIYELNKLLDLIFLKSLPKECSETCLKQPHSGPKKSVAWETWSVEEGKCYTFYTTFHCDMIVLVAITDTVTGVLFSCSESWKQRTSSDGHFEQKLCNCVLCMMISHEFLAQYAFYTAECETVGFVGWIPVYMYSNS